MADSETKFKSFKWSKNTTLLLISLINKNYNQLQSGVKKITFQQIAQEINNRLGTNLVYDQVDSKWKGLKRTYLKMKNSPTKLSWEFYTLIDEILKDDTEINASVIAKLDDVYRAGCETEFGFVEYTMEPERSTFRQNRKKRESNSDEDHSKKEKCSSAENISGGVRKSRISTAGRKGKVVRREYSKEDRNHRGRRSKITDTDRYNKECRSRLISDDGRSDYECRGCQRSHDRYKSIEEAKERRHQEKMKIARKFLAIFERMVDRT